MQSEAPVLSSDFNIELGALIRALEAKIRNEPGLIHEGPLDTLDHIDRAIISLVAWRIHLKRLATETEK